MKLSVAEINVLIDSLQRSLCIVNYQGAYDKDTLIVVKDKLERLLNDIEVNIELPEDDNN